MRFKLLVFVTTIFLLISIYSVMAYDMSSENYRLEIEGIDMGAIGDIKDFSDSDQKFLSINNLKEIFTSHFSWKMALIFVAGFLILAFILYLIVKKTFVSKR